MPSPRDIYRGTVDVIVVGAGFSGLAAAKRPASTGKSVIVLEARDRVGGKVYDKKTANGAILELGAAYVGPCQDRIFALAEELGVSTYQHYDIDQSVCYNAGSRVTYDAENAPIGEEGHSQLEQAFGALDSMAQKLDAHELDEPAKLNSGTPCRWRRGCNPRSRTPTPSNCSRALLSAEPEDISFLQFLAYINRAGNETNPGNLARLISTKNGAQERRLDGGPQLIAIRLSERLGNIVKLGSPVIRIELHDGVYHVSGVKFSAKSHSVILALSPPLATRITYSPPLPARRDQMSQLMPLGSLGKAIATYTTPFWREDISGSAVGISGCTVQTTFDCSPKDGSSGAIIEFLEANEMRRLDSASEADIQRLVVEYFLNYFGPKARNVEEWMIQRWDDEEYSRVGHFAICPQNVMTQFGPYLSERVGNIFFAGTEASPYWAGFMDGAIRAGEIAADEICCEHQETSSARL